MRAAGSQGILGSAPRATGRPPGSKRSPPMRTLRTATTHARYLLSAFAAVAFGTSFN
jgi:hypothetical protein